MGNKSGQAAMEFLMTYSWALIIILIVVAAIVYFGVTNPKDFLPNRCLFSPEIGCVGSSLSSADDTFKIKLKNNFGDTITVTNLDLSAEDSPSFSCTNPTLPVNWKNLESIDLTYTACDLASVNLYQGKTVKLALDLSFYPVKLGSSYVTNVKGEIVTKVS
jgi:hypothetical protein